MLNDTLSSIREAASAYWLILSIIAMVALVAIVVTVFVYLDVVESGFEGKTAWDWLDMLVVPIVGVCLAGLFALAKVKADQRSEDARELAEERTQVETLSTYLDCMQELMTRQHLQPSTDHPYRAVARARTFAALRILNGTRKGLLLRFLHESGLTTGGEPLMDLALADLTNVDLVGADLEGINLEGANLGSGDLNGADLRGSRLVGCLLNDADLGHADLEDAQVDIAQLARCRDLVGVRLPDGERVDEDRWAEMRGAS